MREHLPSRVFRLSRRHRDDKLALRFPNSTTHEKTPATPSSEDATTPTALVEDVIEAKKPPAQDHTSINIRRCGSAEILISPVREKLGGNFGGSWTAAVPSSAQLDKRQSPCRSSAPDEVADDWSECLVEIAKPMSVGREGLN